MIPCSHIFNLCYICSVHPRHEERRILCEVKLFSGKTRMGNRSHSCQTPKWNLLRSATEYFAWWVPALNPHSRLNWLLEAPSSFLPSTHTCRCSEWAQKLLSFAPVAPHSSNLQAILVRQQMKRKLCQNVTLIYANLMNNFIFLIWFESSVSRLQTNVEITSVSLERPTFWLCSSYIITRI